MTLKVSDITDVIEAYAPLEGSDHWDNSGLQVGDLASEVNVVALALDADEVSVRSAVDRKAELLITHHPLIFPAITSVDTRTGAGKAIAAAVTGNLSVYSSHTSLDHSLSGTSFTLAQRLSLTGIAPLPQTDTPSETEREDGVVVQGRLKTPMKLVEIAAFVKKALGAPMIRSVGDDRRPIRSVAVCAGSGGDFVSTAAASGVDLLIVGEIRYHDGAGGTRTWIERDRGGAPLDGDACYPENRAYPDRNGAQEKVGPFRPHDRR